MYCCLHGYCRNNKKGILHSIYFLYTQRPQLLKCEQSKLLQMLLGLAGPETVMLAEHLPEQGGEANLGTRCCRISAPRQAQQHVEQTESLPATPPGPLVKR